MKRLSLALYACILFLPLAGRAAPAVFVGEVAWAGSKTSTSDEWLELCGTAGTDLGGWSIDGAASGNQALTLPAGAAIGSGGTFLISNYAADDSKSTLAAAPDFVTTAVSLSNSALFLTLRDASGNAVDVVGRAGAAPDAGSSGALKASMERLFPLLAGDAPEAWTSATASVGFDTGATELGTPGTCPSPAEAPAEDPHTPSEETSTDTLPATETVSTTDTPTASATETPAVSATETPSVSATGTSSLPIDPPAQTSTTASGAAGSGSAVRISEAYPWPHSGEREWIELVNPSDTGEVLDGWAIVDGKNTATALSGTILPWSRIVIETPKGQLNNGGDLIALKDVSGRVIDGVAYGDWTDAVFPNVGGIAQGQALMRRELQETFAVTSTPTRGLSNVLTAPVAPATSTMPAHASVPAPDAEKPVPVPHVSVPPQPVALPKTAPKPPPSFTAVTTLKTAPKSAAKSKAKPKTPAAPKYKGASYTGIIASPPGVYAKARLFALIDGAIREVRLSKAPPAPYAVGARIAFVAQEKSDGGEAYLSTNPGSIRTLDRSASATFATIDAWPAQAGAYRFNAEIISKRAGALEAKLGGIEGDVLTTAALMAPLKTGDIVTVEGYVMPGTRPRAVLARPTGLTLFQAYHSGTQSGAPAQKLPWQATAGGTAAVVLVGLWAYLRHQRLQRLAMTLRPLDAEEEV